MSRGSVNKGVFVTFLVVYWSRVLITKRAISSIFYPEFRLFINDRGEAFNRIGVEECSPCGCR